MDLWTKNKDHQKSELYKLASLEPMIVFYTSLIHISCKYYSSLRAP